jgi:RNA polymerase sigma-70 factor (ECF subfamily)
LTTDVEAEFTALVERQSRFVFRVAYAVLLNAHDAEDAVQETFLKLYRNGGWRELDNARAFLARVTWRVAVDRRRASRPNDAITAPELDLEAALDPPSPHPGPEQALVAANQHALVHLMIDALPEDLRMPLVLSASDELNSREIAIILGIPEGTVRTRLQRARQVLRQRLANVNARNLTSNQETQHA